jgi:PRTRC genetic system protein C
MATTTSKRIFKYHDQTWDDPGAEFTVDQVKAHLTGYFPELAQATTQERKLEDGSLEITFVKKAGTKGGGDNAPAVWDAAEIARRITDIPPLRIRAVEILAEIEAGELTIARLVQLQPEIERAELQLAEHVMRAGQLSLTLAALPAIPSRVAPTGF